MRRRSSSGQSVAFLTNARERAAVRVRGAVSRRPRRDIDRRGFFGRCRRCRRPIRRPAEWLDRRESYDHLLQRVPASSSARCACSISAPAAGWLSHRLAALGHRVVAVDAWTTRRMDWARGGTTDRVSGVQADFDALPFAPNQFDLVVFNGSLHYAPDPAASLRSARRMLSAGGAVAVMDSPMFRRDADGAAMVADQHAPFAGRARRSLSRSARASGYLTFAGLGAIADPLGLRSQFVRSRGPLPWRLRRPRSDVRVCGVGRRRSACGWRDDRSLQPALDDAREAAAAAVAAVAGGGPRRRASWTLVDGNVTRDPAGRSSRGSGLPRDPAQLVRRHGDARPAADAGGRRVPAGQAAPAGRADRVGRLLPDAARRHRARARRSSTSSSARRAKARCCTCFAALRSGGSLDPS